MNWFFNLESDGVVHLMARLEDGDAIGDAHNEVQAGEEFYGVSYDEMKQARSGRVEVDDEGRGHIRAD
jgi:hypothetical protein